VVGGDERYISPYESEEEENIDVDVNVDDVEPPFQIPDFNDDYINQPPPNNVPPPPLPLNDAVNEVAQWFANDMRNFIGDWTEMDSEAGIIPLAMEPMEVNWNEAAQNDIGFMLGFGVRNLLENIYFARRNTSFRWTRAAIGQVNQRIEIVHTVPENYVNAVDTVNGETIELSERRRVGYIRSERRVLDENNNNNIGNQIQYGPLQFIPLTGENRLKCNYVLTNVTILRRLRMVRFRLVPFQAHSHGETWINYIKSLIDEVVIHLGDPAITRCVALAVFRTTPIGVDGRNTNSNINGMVYRLHTRAYDVKANANEFYDDIRERFVRFNEKHVVYQADVNNPDKLVEVRYADVFVYEPTVYLGCLRSEFPGIYQLKRSNSVWEPVLATPRSNNCLFECFVKHLVENVHQFEHNISVSALRMVCECNGNEMCTGAQLQAVVNACNVRYAKK
jgi:hypothetical protein